MAEINFSDEERKQHIESIEEQVKYLEEAERELQMVMSEDEEKAWKEEAKNLQKPVQLHRSIFNFASDPFSDERLKREAYSLRTKKEEQNSLQDEIRVVINGKTGKGKSSLGTNLLGYHQFTSRVSLKRITIKCKDGVRYLDEEYKLLVVDTLGLFDSEIPNEEMSAEITKCVGLAAPGPNIFIFVVSTEIFSPEEKKTLNNLQKLFGEKVIDHVIIVFTRKELLEDLGIMEFFKYADDILLDLLVKCKFRFAFINNRADPDDLRVDIDVILDLIFKTIGENNGAYYTNKERGIVERGLGNMIKEREEEKVKEREQLKEQKRKLLAEQEEETGFIKASEESIIKGKKPQQSEEKGGEGEEEKEEGADEEKEEEEEEEEEKEEEERKPQDELAGFKKVEEEIHDVGTTLREISIFLKEKNTGIDESGIGNIEEKYENIQKLFYDQSKTDSESSNNEYMSMLISEIRNLKQNVNDLMAFLKENKTRKSSGELANELNSDFDIIMQSMDSMVDKMSLCQTVNVNPRIEVELGEIDKRIIDTQNINVYYEKESERELQQLKKEERKPRDELAEDVGFKPVETEIPDLIREKESKREPQKLEKEKMKLRGELPEDVGFKTVETEIPDLIKEKESERELEEMKHQDELLEDAGLKKVEAEIHDVGATLREMCRFLKQINIGNDKSGIRNIEEKYENIQKLFYDQSKTDSESPMLISDVRNIKQNVNDLMTFLRENKTRKSSGELAKELKSEFDIIMPRINSLGDRMSTYTKVNNTLDFNPRIERNARKIDQLIEETQNISVYHEAKYKNEKGGKKGTFEQTLKKVLNTTAEEVHVDGDAVGAAAAVVVVVLLVAAGAGVAAAASWISSWW